MANAGVVGMAEVVVPSSAPSGRNWASGGPAMWSFVWVGFAAFVLTFLHLAIMGRGR
jgi:hypothetical protein